MKTIEVYADVRCPFTHVGLRRLIETRAERGGGPALIVRAWPLELVNDAPLDGDHIAAEVDAIRDQVAADLFADFRVDRFPASSLPALALTAAAYEVGAGVGEQVALAVRDAMFEGGLDIADPAVLADIAQRHDVPAPTAAHATRVTADWAEGKERGVIGSPHFIVDGMGFFCPALQISHDETGFQVSVDQAGFDAFLAAAFSG